MAPGSKAGSCKVPYPQEDMRKGGSSISKARSYKEIGNFRDTHGLSDVYNTWPSSQDAIVPTYP